MISPPEAKKKRRIRLILFNGFLREHKYPFLWMKPLTEYLKQKYGEQVEIIGNEKPAVNGDINKYVEYVGQMIAKSSKGWPPDADTYFIGQSIGFQVLVRFLAQLPPGSKGGGLLGVGCWLTLDYKTRRRRSRAIDDLIEEYWSVFQGWMDYSGIDFPNVRRVCHGNVLALISDNDPFRGLDDDGISNKQDFEEIVQAKVIFRKGKAHFNCEKLDAEDTALIESFLGLHGGSGEREEMMVDKKTLKARL